MAQEQTILKGQVQLEIARSVRQAAQEDGSSTRWVAGRGSAAATGAYATNRLRGTGGGPGDIGADGDRLANQTLDIREQWAFLAVADRDRQAGRSCPTGPAHPREAGNSQMRSRDCWLRRCGGETCLDQNLLDPFH